MAILRHLLTITLFLAFSSIQAATLYQYDGVNWPSPEAYSSWLCTQGTIHSCQVELGTTVSYRAFSGSPKYYKYVSIVEDDCSTLHADYSDYTEEGGFCVEPDVCLANAGTSEPVSFYPSGTPTSVCNGSCSGALNCTTDSWTIVEDGEDKVYRECSVAYYADSATCTGSDETSFTELPDDSCAAGQSIGDVNGQTICVNADGSVEDTRPNTISNDNTSTTYSEVTNPDGSKTQTKTTTSTKSDGTSSTSTTTTEVDPTGNVTEETTDTEEQEKENTYTDSGCDSPPVCKGDAIQCAIAHNTWNTDCFFSTDTTNITEDGLGIPVEDRTNEVGDTTSISSVLDTSSFLADTCPAPRTINVAYGSTMTLDYAPLCEIADIIGSVILISASIISIRIIGGGF